MPQLLLLLLLLAPCLAALSTIPSGPAATDDAAARALLAELTQHLPPQPLPGVSCPTLHPTALPGFTRLPPAPRALARAALALALSAASCEPQARAELPPLSRELGPEAAAALLRGLARLRATPAPRALAPLLLSLARPQGSGGPCVAQRDPAAAGRCRRGAEDACDPPGEREAHGVLQWVPAAGAFYNLGTSIYYAFQGCDALASSRALEAAEDLGYAGLSAIVASVGGPAALGVQLGLQPGLKAGVRALIRYFTSAGAPLPVPTAHSGAVLVV
ncbi:apolipoprotein F [Colius striatus]|uniref:apolipoprotein F n=1 Tax=Colius striatus TaxID=57412 RepID=UPI002B1E78C5|nr:apolipoprotein F [Colius striatus]